ncbi:MAG: CDP-diacylglycerol--glycerol-3-phosphate 3-phosphatidyltransferase [Candidatus Omnitrophota bacterium]
MNLANKLTMARIGMTFLLMWFLFMEGMIAKVIALVIFLAACGTDFLDGWVARRRKETSDFGKLMDPIADKILVIGIFLAFVELRLVPAWMVIVIIAREFLITGLRLFAIRKGVVLAAERAGKHKTVSQMLTIFVILLFVIFKESFSGSGQARQAFENGTRTAILLLMSGTVFLTLASGFSYLWQNRKLIKGF